MERVNHDIAIRVWSQPFSVDTVKTIHGKEFRLINLPFYYIGQLMPILTDVMESVAQQCNIVS